MALASLAFAISSTMASLAPLALASGVACVEASAFASREEAQAPVALALVAFLVAASASKEGARALLAPQPRATASKLARELAS